MMGIENQIFEEEYGKVADELRATKKRAAALAAEVERLTADNAALRAQLDAGEEPWHDMEDAPANGQVIQVITTIRFNSNKNEYWQTDLDGYHIGARAEKWRPAPPQE